jgi:hypothetical protein
LKSSFFNTKFSLFIEGIFFSALLIITTAGIQIVNPNYVDWLQTGDGTMEIAWEFFRNQPIFQFPLGLNPKYGLEISSTIALDGNVPLFSLFFHPFSFLLPPRFQYLGIFLLLSFAFNYYFAQIIFKQLNLNEVNSRLGAILLATSPVILNRYIENTHYTLTSAFILFYAIYLVLKSDSSFIKWNCVYLISILIFFYYTAIIAIIHIIFISQQIYVGSEKIKNAFIKFIGIGISCYIVMYFTGFFYGGVSASDVGYGLFKSTLTSLIDPTGWSRFLPDIKESTGAYEGFSYVGISTIILVLVFIFLFKKSQTKITGFVPEFKILWIAGIFLYIFSLSNKIAIADIEIFQYPLPTFLESLIGTFRSTGRFAWLIVFILSIWLIYKISLKISVKNLTLVLILVIIFSLFDMKSQLMSQKNIKFSSPYISNLKSPAWQKLNKCYKNIRVFPPSMAVDNYYNFVNMAYQNKMGINTGRFGRANQGTINQAYEQMGKDFIFGTLETDSFYIFTDAEYILPEVIDFHKYAATFSLDSQSGIGKIDGYDFIAPNIKNCDTQKPLKVLVTQYGVNEEKKYRGDKLLFGLGRDSSKYRLIGFSPLQEWGVWSVDEYSDLVLNISNNFRPKLITIEAKSQSVADRINSVNVYLNDKEIGVCTLQVSISKCQLLIPNDLYYSSIMKVTFRPDNPISPFELGISDDKTQLGIGLVSIQLS